MSELERYKVGREREVNGGRVGWEGGGDRDNGDKHPVPATAVCTAIHRSVLLSTAETHRVLALRKKLLSVGIHVSPPQSRGERGRGTNSKHAIQAQTEIAFDGFRVHTPLWEPVSFADSGGGAECGPTDLCVTLRYGSLFLCCFVTGATPGNSLAGICTARGGDSDSGRGRVRSHAPLRREPAMLGGFRER